MGSHRGKVYLVGAGPGDPGLITVRGRELLEQAGVVIYDALSHPALLSHAHRAEHIYVGKKTNQHCLPQEDIGRVLVEQAERHRVVVRLKGGDPFVFGRGGEEALALVAAGIEFEVVPGVTAGVGASAYAGIPVTHRGISGSVTFITGHHAQDTDGMAVSIKNLGRTGTLVFYMGVKTLPVIVASLLDLGRKSDTPVAVIEWGTYARQRTVTGTLDTIESVVHTAKIEAPALIVVGETVGLRDEISWFEQRPLFGLRVVLTHASQSSDTLAARLRELGASVLAFPTVSFSLVEEEVDELKFNAMDWLVLSSVNSVAMVFEALERQGLDSRALAGVKICAVGQSTQVALKSRGILADATPLLMKSTTITSEMESLDPLMDKSIVIPRSDISRSSLAMELRKRGAQVEEVVAYASQVPLDAAGLRERVVDFAPELVVFTNSNAARNYARIMKGDVDHVGAYASIGPVTTLAATESGLPINIEPQVYDIPNLLEAICGWRTDKE